MQRGVITFTTQEQKIIYQILHDFVPDLTQLQQKFLVTQTGGELEHLDSIELSRDEVELILDQMPIPSGEEPEEVSHIRSLLSSFLNPVK